MATFGTGDYGSYNDWAFASGTFYTNWNTSQFSPGILGRITALAARWDAYSGLAPGTASGSNVLWRATTNLNVAQTGSITGTSRGAGTTETMHNATCSDLWVAGTANYFLGFSLTSGSSHIHAWADGAHGGYSGKSAGSANNTGGTANWGGTTNGGLPVFGTVTISNVFVRRGGAWVRVFVSTRRSSAWNSFEYVRVKRSGVWTIVNWMQEGERHVPPGGMPVEVNVDGYWEPGWMIEDGETSWFGSVDPTTPKWSGRYHSLESDEIAEERLRAMYEWDKALREERYQEAKVWRVKFEPPMPIEELIAVGA